MYKLKTYLKMNFKLVLALFMLLAVIYCNARNVNIIEFNDEDELEDISSFLMIYEDSTNQLSFEDILSKEFIATKSSVPNLGISKSSFWIKVPINNNTSNNNLILELSLPITDYIEFYYPSIDNQYHIIKTGDEFPFNKRKYKDPNYLFDINIEKGETKVFYLKVRSNEAIQLPIKIGTKSNIYSEIKNRDLLSGIYFGIMLVMILYNLFLYFSIRDKSYLFYVIYIICILLTQTSLQGYTFQYLWPNNPFLSKYSLILFPSLSAITGMWFMNVYLRTKEYSKRLFLTSIFLIIPFLFAYTIAFSGEIGASQGIIQLGSGIVSIYLLITPIIIYRKGFKPAKYFIAAWSIFLLGVIAFILKDADVLPFNNYTRYTMQIGSGIETILLSFALAARINVYKRERLEAVQEKEKLLKEQNIVLEKKVDERTKELNQTLKKLKDTQVQLVDAEKMSSLGQLTAGIAHEINNPINFVSSNIVPLRQDLDDIKSILSKYEEIDNINIEDKLKEIESLKKELDYEYLKTELSSIINGIEDGARRTTEIVIGLRNFSSLDESELKKVDINVGINSTIVLIKNKLNGINISTNLSDKAECECNPGKINQIIMNIIDNSIYAIKKIHSDYSKGKIEIETEDSNSFIFITISDNGIGIPDNIKSKIFDPFFTTKDVGEGTGLGLAIVKGILENHNGSIEIESTPNTGTKVTIKLPKTKVDGKN